MDPRLRRLLSMLPPGFRRPYAQLRKVFAELGFERMPAFAFDEERVRLRAPAWTAILTAAEVDALAAAVEAGTVRDEDMLQAWLAKPASSELH